MSISTRVPNGARKLKSASTEKNTVFIDNKQKKYYRMREMIYYQNSQPLRKYRPFLAILLLSLPLIAQAFSQDEEGEEFRRSAIILKAEDLYQRWRYGGNRSLGTDLPPFEVGEWEAFREKIATYRLEVQSQAQKRDDRSVLLEEYLSASREVLFLAAAVFSRAVGGHQSRVGIESAQPLAPPLTPLLKEIQKHCS